MNQRTRDLIQKGTSQTNQQTVQRLQLEQIGTLFAKNRPPFGTSILLFGSGALAFIGFVIVVGSNDFFTPLHTNSFNLYGSLLAHSSLVLTAGLFGLSLTQFSVMPGITKTVSTSIIQRITSSPLSLVTLFYTSFITLELLDRFNLFSIGPLCLGTGYLVTVAYQRARALAVPLWFSKQVARYGAFSILTLLFSGYCMLAREM